MFFTLKKFRLIGARARIKKIIQILEACLPTLQSAAPLVALPTYLDYLMTLNAETREFRFTDDELARLREFHARLTQIVAGDAVAVSRAFAPQEHQQVFKFLMELRYFLGAKIQTPIRETSLIVLERDATERAPLRWPTEIVVVLDHLRSPYNVGAIIRTMECVGLHRLVSIGYTPRLDSRQVQRSAMGCEQGMTVVYSDDAVAAVQTLQRDGFKACVLETIMPSWSVFALDAARFKDEKLALIIGNEEFGVDEGLIARADYLWHIPTFGKKNSLNVSIAFSITVYQLWQALLG